MTSTSAPRVADCGKATVPTEPGELVMHVARRLRRTFAASLEPLGLVPHQARALRVVCAHDGARLSDVAAALRIAPRSGTEVVDGLQAKRLVARRPDPADRRAALVVPTEEGRQLNEQITQMRQEGADELFAPLDAADRRMLTDLLQRLLAE